MFHKYFWCEFHSKIFSLEYFSDDIICMFSNSYLIIIESTWKKVKFGTIIFSLMRQGVMRV